MSLTKSNYFYKIPSLSIPENIYYNDIHAHINKYIDTIPRLIEKLEYNLANKRYKYVVNNIDIIYSLLENIYAQEFITEIDKIKRKLDFKAKFDNMDLINPIKTLALELASLSIELQKAQKLNNKEYANKSKANNSSKKILAVGEKPDILSFINGTLQKHYKVFKAFDTNAALEILSTQTPDLFILDIDMQGMNGYKLAGIIRSIDDYAFTPIIFLTKSSQREYVSKAIDAGGNDFIIKPAKNEPLLLKVNKFLSQPQYSL